MTKVTFAGIIVPGGDPESFIDPMNPSPPSTHLARHFREQERVFTPRHPVWSDEIKHDQVPVTPLHYHSLFEIILSKGARGQVRGDRWRHPLTGDGMFIFPPNRLHGMELEKGPGTVIILQVSPQACASVLDLSGMEKVLGFSWDRLPVMDADYRSLRPLATRLATLGREAKAHPADIYRHLAALFGSLSKMPPAKTDAVGGDSFLNSVIEWTTAHFRRDVTLVETAAHLSVSRGYFCRAFKERTGTTWVQYLTSLRLEEAGRLMLSGASATDAAYASGFNDLSYFIKTFKRNRGMTPARFRGRLIPTAGASRRG